jgi:hypothetical protein
VEEVAVGFAATDERVQVAPVFSSSRIIGLVGARQTGKVEPCVGDSDAGMLGREDLLRLAGPSS